MNTRVQIDILMRIKSSHRFGDFSNPEKKLVIENYFDDVMGVKAPSIAAADEKPKL